MNKRLFVAGLPFTSTEEDLKNLFAGVGNVVSASIINDRETGRSRGFAFVEMETTEEVASAIAKLNNTEFGGRKLIVTEARPREDRGDRFQPRSGFAGKRGFDKRRTNFGRREGGRGNFGRKRGYSR